MRADDPCSCPGRGADPRGDGPLEWSVDDRRRPPAPL